MKNCQYFAILGQNWLITNENLRYTSTCIVFKNVTQQLQCFEKCLDIKTVEFCHALN